MALDQLLYTLRSQALASLGSPEQLRQLPYVSTLDPFSVVRFLADLRPESDQAVFAGSHHQNAMKDIKAFDAAVGDAGSSMGYGTFVVGEAHTNLRTKRRLNESAGARVLGIVLCAQPVKVPVTTTDANTLVNDADGAQLIAPDPGGFVQRHVADVMANDYLPYFQIVPGEKERLGKIRWQSDESGILYAAFVNPEGWDIAPGASGTGREFVVGFERVKQTINREWAADTDRPWEDIADGIGFSVTGSQPAARTCCVNFDVEVRLICAQFGR